MSLMTRDAFIACLRLKSKTIYILTALVISLVASFCIVANTHAAGTADIKEDFGAIGDGVTDDSDAILAAFASDYSEITFPEGEYRFTKQLTFAKGDKTIKGEKATLFTDDTYTAPGHPSNEEWAIRIRNANHIIFKGMHFEARQTETNPGYKAIIGVMQAEDIHIDNCRISTVRNTSERIFTPIDFWGGWHNVSVTNSRIESFNDNDGESGGGIALRDIAGWGASGGKFINNVVYKFGHDEALWISESKTTAMVEDIEISGNRFYVGDPILSANVYTISFEANAPGVLKNIRIFDNEIIGQGTGYLLQLRGSENVDIYNNDLHAKVSNIGQSGGFAAVIGSNNGTGNISNTPGTVQIHDNRTITLDSDIDISGVTQGWDPYDFTDNPHIIVNAPNASFLVNNRGAFSDNSIILNGNAFVGNGGGIIGANAGNVQDNNILINGFTDVFIRRFMSNLAEPATYTGNHITTTKKITERYPERYTTLTRMWAFSMNDHPVTIEGNTFVNGSEIEENESLATFTVTNTGSNIITDRTQTEPYSHLWVIQVNDTTPANQVANICNNTFKGFRTKRANNSITPTINLTCN